MLSIVEFFQQCWENCEYHKRHCQGLQNNMGTKNPRPIKLFISKLCIKTNVIRRPKFVGNWKIEAITRERVSSLNLITKLLINTQAVFFSTPRCEVLVRGQWWFPSPLFLVCSLFFPRVCSRSMLEDFKTRGSGNKTILVMDDSWMLRP